MKQSKTKIACLIGAAFTGLAFNTASAQISGDVVKIGFVTDISGTYADIDGPGGVEAIRSDAGKEAW